MLRGFFRVFEFLFAAPVAALLDEGAGAFEFSFVAEEAGAVEVDVGQVQPHGAALGNLPGFVEIRPRQVRLALHHSQSRARK
jgi:hypothetical protein